MMNIGRLSIDRLVNKVFLYLVAIFLLLSACQPSGIPTADGNSGTAASPAFSSGKSVVLQVFAAASLTEAFNALRVEFERLNPGIQVIFNFAGSQALAQQLIQGAPADVFASANMAQVQNVADEGRVDVGAARIFATNRLIVILPADNPGEIYRLQDLAKPGLRLVLAASEVPVGKYSQEFIQKAAQHPDFQPDFAAAITANVVSYEDNVKAVLAKVRLGEADAGVVYASDASGDTVDGLAILEIPAGLNVVALYPMVPILDSRYPQQAQAWMDFVLSNQGQSILGEFEFSPAP